MADENLTEQNGGEPEPPMDDAFAGPPAQKGRVNVIVAASMAALVIIAAVGIFYSFKFVEDERQRELTQWQIRLGIVADSRVAGINDWIAANFDTIADLSENQSLQLYMTQLAAAQGDRSQVVDGAAEEGYLRNLLVATAERSGFSPPPPLQEVNANVERVGVAGMALTNATGTPIVVTPEMPPIAGRLRDAAATALEGRPAFVDMYRGASNLPTMGFALPVYAIQAESGGAEAIGVAFGLRVVDDAFYELLKQPGDTSTTAETYLVRKTATTVEYLSPLRDGTAPLHREMALDTDDLAAAFAFEKPGGFAIRRNYSGDEVLVTSRPIAGLPWMLVRTITRAEALSPSEGRLNTIRIVFILIVIGVTIAILGVWRHGTSLRAAAAAEKFRIAAERFENMTKFMRVVTNSQPTAIVAVDGETHYTFANEPAASEAGISPDDMLGKTMASVMGPVKASYYAEVNRGILKDFAAAEDEEVENSVQLARAQHVHTFYDEDAGPQVIKSEHVPLRGDRDHPPGVLMVLDDITEFSRERLRGEARLRQLVGTLVNVVDRRDPLLANRSNNIATVARSLATELGLEDVEADTAEFAGNLLSIGNIYIPTETLSKAADDLTGDERQSLEQSYRVSAELLDGVDFEGPVVDTIRQTQEHWDGSGLGRLSGESILVTARIVAVAKAFVDMTSPTAGGEGATFEDAANTLLQEAGTLYDRKVVAALLNYLENRGGTENWAHFRERPSE